MVGHLYDFGQKKSTSTAPSWWFFGCSLKTWKFHMKFHDPTAQSSTTLGNNFADTTSQRCNIFFSDTTLQQFLGCSQMLKPWGGCSGRFRFFIGSHAWRPEQLMMRVTLLATTNLTASFDCTSIFPVFSLKKTHKKDTKSMDAMENRKCLLCIDRYHISAFLDIIAKLESPTTTGNFVKRILPLQIWYSNWKAIHTSDMTNKLLANLGGKKPNCDQWLCKPQKKLQNHLQSYHCKNHSSEYT